MFGETLTAKMATGIAVCVAAVVFMIVKPGEISFPRKKSGSRKLKFAAIFGICWFAFLVLLVDGILKFQTLLDYFGSYALVESSLILLVVLPTLAVYIFTKE